MIENKNSNSDSQNKFAVAWKPESDIIHFCVLSNVQSITVLTENIVTHETVSASIVSRDIALKAGKGSWKWKDFFQDASTGTIFFTSFSNNQSELTRRSRSNTGSR